MTTLVPTKDRSASQSWVRALERTASIAKNPRRLLADVIDELADKFDSAPALLSDTESLTYRDLSERSNRYARWALDHGVTQGDVVCLFMPNRPEYMAIWLGITRIGAIVSLLNTQLRGPALGHCVHVVAPRHIIVDSSLADAWASVDAVGDAEVWAHGEMGIERYSGAALRDDEGQGPALHDTALYIYTSGTTGLPKAARVSHSRVLQWSYWFAGLTDARPGDRMYNCLPMYHSVGGVVATGAVLTAGGSVVVRQGFSARQFWEDVVRWECTLFQYIGELCRYLLHAEVHSQEGQHRIRMCCGNGLSPDVWTAFTERFQIPQVLEFYAATEGNFSLFNVEGKVGSIGRIPPFLAHRFPVALVRFNFENALPVRNEQGFCVPCAPNESGEAIGRISSDPSQPGGRFEGYTDEQASERKILRDVFEPGDAWFRTGDLMRKDEKGFFYFVDRIGDTFRWKGENVATSEVSGAICAFPAIREAKVYGVSVPGSDGKAGMAAIVAGDTVDLPALRVHLGSCLPRYAQPVFLRLSESLPVTATLKQTTEGLAREGYDPGIVSDTLYFNDFERAAFVPLDQTLFDRIQSGKLRI